MRKSSFFSGLVSLILPLTAINCSNHEGYKVTLQGEDRGNIAASITFEGHKREDANVRIFNYGAGIKIIFDLQKNNATSTTRVFIPKASPQGKYEVYLDEKYIGCIDVE